MELNNYFNFTAIRADLSGKKKKGDEEWLYWLLGMKMNGREWMRFVQFLADSQ